MSMITSYAKEILARLKGDKAAEVAAYNERKSSSTIRGNISTLEGMIVDQEEAIKDAEEALKDAYYPIEKITDNKRYLEGIKNAQARLEERQELLKDTNESIAYWKKVLATFGEMINE